MTAVVTRRSHLPAHKAVWWSLLLYPFSFVAAFVVGDGLASLLGHPVGEGTGDLPLWVVLAAGVPALLVFAVPAFVAVHFGRRAVAEGHPNAAVPMWLAVALAALFTLQNLVAYLVG